MTMSHSSVAILAPALMLVACSTSQSEGRKQKGDAAAEARGDADAAASPAAASAGGSEAATEAPSNADASASVGSAPTDGSGNEQDAGVAEARIMSNIVINPELVSLAVDATSHQVSTGLFLQAGDQVSVSAVGAWTNWVGAIPPFGPEGQKQQKQSGCSDGALQALISFYDWNKTKPTPFQIICVGKKTQFIAKVSGPLYLAMNDSLLTDNQGVLNVQVSAPTAKVMPTITRGDFATYTPPANASPWLEVAGKHGIITLPTQTFMTYRNVLGGLLDRIDRFYAFERQLVGFDPYPKQVIRYYGGINPDQAYAGLSGNPILVARIDQVIADCVKAQGASCWTWSHEMGHDFTTTLVGNAAYMYGISGEAWANLVNTYALQQMQMAEGQRWQQECQQHNLGAYLRNGNVQTFKADPWLPLCFLMELQQVYGWAMWQKFFELYRGQGHALYVGKYGDAANFGVTRDLLNQASGRDVSNIFSKYHLPLP